MTSVVMIPPKTQLARKGGITRKKDKSPTSTKVHSMAIVFVVITMDIKHKIVKHMENITK
jgi:hypothetical protein